MRRLSNLLSAFLLILSVPLAAQPGPSVTELPENISIHQLDNGLQVLLIENPALPMVGVNVVVKVGSAYESFATSGMSHMLEHLLFNGTTSRTQKELYDQADRIGGYNNANTGEYYTNFMMVTPAEYSGEGMEIQADMLFNSTMPQEKFEKEKGIVLEEIAKSLANAEEQYDRNRQAILFPGHALSLPTLGTYSTIEHMQREDVWRFYKEHYVPNNMIMSVIGRFDRQQMMEQIKSIYGNFAPGAVAPGAAADLATGFADIPARAWGETRLFHRTYGGTTRHLQMFYDLPLLGNDQFFDLLEVAFELQLPGLEKAVKEKFPQLVRSLKINVIKKPVAAYVEADITLSGEGDYNKLATFVNTSLIAMSFALEPQTLQTEVSKRRTGFLKNIEKPHMFGIYNAQIFAEGGIGRVLSSYGSAGFMQAADALADFNLSKARLLLLQYPDEQTSGRAVDSSVVTRYLPGNDESPDLIVRQNPGSPLLAIHYMVKHKASLESEYGKDAAKLLHACIGIRLDSPELKKESAAYGLTYVVNDNPFIPMDNIYLHPDFGYIRIEGLSEQSSGIISLLNKTLTNFQPTAQEYEQAIAKMGRSAPMMGMGSQAKKIFENKLEENLYVDNPYPPGKQISTLQQLVAFSQVYFKPGNMIIAVVGPLNPGQTAQAFSSFKGKTPESLPRTPFDTRFKMLDQSLQLQAEGDGEQAYLYWGFLKDVKDEDKPALQALSLVLADRIIFDVREKQGMAYRMKAGVAMKGDRAAFYVNMATRPQNVDALLPQFPDFFKTDYLADLTEEDVSKSINMYLGRMMFRRLSSINQAFYLSQSLYFQDDINYDQKFLDELKMVNLETIKSVAEKYLKAEHTIQLVVK